MASSNTYDLVVIGAGSGGLAVAKRAAGYGKSVALIENDRTGGTCVIRGCVPKKIMSYAAQYADTLADAHGYGFNVKSSFDFAQLAQKRNAEVDRLENMHKEKLAQTGVTLISGKGTLNPENPHSVLVHQENGQTLGLEATYIVLATGGHAFMPPVPGHEHAITSDGVFDLKALPETIAIVGGGYIGVEFASIFNALGSKVHLIVRRKSMLGGFDEDIRQSLADEMKKRGIVFECVCNVEKIEKINNGQRQAHLDNGKTIKADVVLMATGRKPNSAGLHLEETGLVLESRTGAVRVGPDLRAEGPHSHIFAIGDLTNRINLTPVAIRDGRIVADNLFKGTNRTTDDTDIGTAVFSIPPLGTVGLTEQQAVEHYGAENIQALKIKFRPMVNVLPNRDEKMLIKAICEKASGRVIGAHLMGRDAPEMVQFITLAIKAGATLEDMHATMPIHPTSAEEFVLLN